MRRKQEAERQRNRHLQFIHLAVATDENIGFKKCAFTCGERRHPGVKDMYKAKKEAFTYVNWCRSWQ